MAAVAAILALCGCLTACSKATSRAAASPRVVAITPAEALAPAAFRAAEAFARAYPAGNAVGEALHAVLPSASPAEVAAFIAGAAADPRVAALVVDPALPGSIEGLARVKRARPKVLRFAGGSREDALEIQASADLVVDLDRLYRAYLIPWAARKMGAKALVAVYTAAEGDEAVTVRERAILSAACAELGLRYAAMVAPPGSRSSARAGAGTGGVAGAAVNVGAAAYVRAMTGAWLREYGRDTALQCSDPALAAPLIAGAIAGGGMVVDAAGAATRADYAAALGLDLGPAKGDSRKERSMLEAAAAGLGMRGRLGLWDADFEEAGLAGLAEFAMRAASGSAKKDSMKDLVAALDARSPGAAWIAAYDVDPGTGVRSANRVLLRQDVYVLGRGYLQSALQTVPAKFLALGEPRR